MRRHFLLIFIASLIGSNSFDLKAQRQDLKALYIPLADHYPGIVAYEKYGKQFQHADFKIQKIRTWPELRAHFMEGYADMAFIISPLAMDMFLESPHFRWVSLIHRDGNALAINSVLGKMVELSKSRLGRKPGPELAETFKQFKQRYKKPILVGVPSLLSTHTIVLYKYLKQFDMTLGIGSDSQQDVYAIEIPPPSSPAFLKKESLLNRAAAFEQSLPWSDIVETGKFGQIAWYSKDVMKWPRGHIECIIIATDKALKHKFNAIKEVIHAIHQAGVDIEMAMTKGGSSLSSIASMIRKHIPEHTSEAIMLSLRRDLSVINYKNLNLDKWGLNQVMDLAVESGALKAPISIEYFMDPRFSTKITEK